MIDTLSIISKGGVVLWEHSSDSSGRRSVVNGVIQEFLLEDRTGMEEATIGDYKVHWALENQAHFFVVAVFPKFVSCPQMGAFVRDVVRSFAKKYGCMQNFVWGDCDFAHEYALTLKKLEVVSSDVDTYPAAEPQYTVVQQEDANDEEMENEGFQEVEEAVTSVSYHDANTIVTRSGAVIGRKGKKTVINKSAHSPTSQKRTKQAKQATRWETPPLDPAVERQMRQQPGATREELMAQAEKQKPSFIRRLANGSAAPVRENEWDNQPRGSVASWLRSFVGRRELDSQDFEKVIPGLRDKLISKNVAVEVADHVCKSVEASLTGKKLGTFESLQQSIESAMVASLHRILQPKHEINILRAVASSKARRKPYSIVLCGVNGVGKSTTLAKITYWLQQNGHSVLIAAGDTFRHGAVEQLEIHGHCLGVPVFQMGYGADPSSVAAAAISRATHQELDVVMIDTAGRMQDHESRMHALAKLIHDNQPDLTLFVGEALVGNSGVDQLRRFNRCLVDYAPVGTAPRGIDGIVLTKFDTVDDKVGAAISMVYELGQPIVFVGAGQTYQDLKIMAPDVVVSALMA
ncbi:Signal recognition particle alpha subunit N terminal SRP54 type protein helical bundle domain [Trypanosoma vivax]|uniref:Putative signal recognition particle receptor like protein n=1 Tax=Trypanosoma vivax (strain Y486) TaxID=1055687 RepID=G0UCL2_TRYVY|nr:putative signal recognition particle receptor like protein [Trypanosoma vivax]KAH8607796.1 Signal recognition particle alpha subunit N terminal SRP54 type protein helical bundle domain [Trypanosoma vivax]CCC53572.1 putative signal recognition particle receptor like protein [Trypanosoma vivax Y486]